MPASKFSKVPVVLVSLPKVNWMIPVPPLAIKLAVPLFSPKQVTSVTFKIEDWISAVSSTST